MDSKRYLTIREVSKSEGISPQAIYQQIDKKLERYVKLVNEKKMLKFEVLKKVYNYNVESTNQSKVDNQFNNDNMKEEIVF